jgi:hypothetical protein
MKFKSGASKLHLSCTRLLATYYSVAFILRTSTSPVYKHPTPVDYFKLHASSQLHRPCTKLVTSCLSVYASCKHQGRIVKWNHNTSHYSALCWEELDVQSPPKRTSLRGEPEWTTARTHVVEIRQICAAVSRVEWINNGVIAWAFRLGSGWKCALFLCL